MIRIVRDTDKLYALVLLHLLSPLALGAIQPDGKALKRSSLGLPSFSRVETPVGDACGVGPRASVGWESKSAAADWESTRGRCYAKN